MKVSDYIIGTVVWAVVVIILCIVYAKLIITSWIFKAYSKGSSDSYHSMTENMKKLVLEYNFREETIDISGVKIHCVIKEHEPPTDDVLVFIHGTASSSVTFFDVMKAFSLSHHQKCIAIDLPNFGISGNMDIEKYTSNEEMCIGYADIIGNTLIQLNIVKKTILIAHSLGGFLSIYVADRFPIKKLVLLNPAGILPTLGVWGYYWAIFFKAGLPTTAFHLPFVSSDGLVNICKKVYGDSNGCDITTDFWLSFFANPNNHGHKILQRVITLHPFYSYWNTPAFSILTDVYRKVPTTICFGVNDTICPPHIGSFLSKLTRGEIMIHNMQNANHNPCANIERMVELLASIIDGTTVTSYSYPYPEQEPESEICNDKLQFCRGFSYHLLDKTRNSFQRIYEYLLTHTTCFPLHSESPL